MMAWNWACADGDFAYPMSLDGHVFRTGLLLRMLRHARFRNPNDLETALHFRRHLAPPAMLSFRESCLLSIPANMVNSTHRGNRVGRDPSSSAVALNTRFLAGSRIAFEQMDFSHVRAPHEEVPFVFTRAGGDAGEAPG